MVYDENSDLLDKTTDQVVTLVSNVGERIDKHFFHNFSQAKYLADIGAIDKIVLKVVPAGDQVRTVDAFRRALGAGHAAVSVLVADGEDELTREVSQSLAQLAPVADKVVAAVEAAQAASAPTASPIPGASVDPATPETVVAPTTQAAPAATTASATTASAPASAEGKTLKLNPATVAAVS